MQRLNFISSSIIKETTSDDLFWIKGKMYSRNHTFSFLGYFAFMKLILERLGYSLEFKNDASGFKNVYIYFLNSEI